MSESKQDCCHCRQHDIRTPAKITAIWIGADGYTTGREVDICLSCLEAGSPSGPGYLATSAPELLRQRDALLEAAAEGQTPPYLGPWFRTQGLTTLDGIAEAIQRDHKTIRKLTGAVDSLIRALEGFLRCQTPGGEKCAPNDSDFMSARAAIAQAREEES